VDLKIKEYSLELSYQVKSSSSVKSTYNIHEK